MTGVVTGNKETTPLATAHETEKCCPIIDESGTEKKKPDQ